MNLSEYITRVGDPKAAELFGVSERTAMSWRLGERRPRPQKAMEIVERTEGEVSYAGCFGYEKSAPKRREAS